jgi:hypothetical protein
VLNIFTVCIDGNYKIVSLKDIWFSQPLLINSMEQSGLEHLIVFKLMKFLVFVEPVEFLAQMSVLLASQEKPWSIELEKF